MIDELASSPVRVVLASNNASLRGLLRSTLLQDRRFIVVAEAKDGDEVLAQPMSCDLTVLDLTISGLGVFGVMSQLHFLHPERPVVVVASTGAPYLRHAALQEGAADYLVVPDELDDLPRRLFATTQREVTFSS